MSTATRGRKAVFVNEQEVRQALKAVQSGNYKSRYLTIKLLNMGLVEATKSKGEGRGRPRVIYSLTEQGQEMIQNG